MIVSRHLRPIRILFFIRFFHKIDSPVCVNHRIFCPGEKVNTDLEQSLHSVPPGARNGKMEFKIHVFLDVFVRVFNSVLH